MPLQFNAAWRFEPKHDPTPRELREEFLDLINRIKAQGDEQEILEAFKIRFASAAGSTSAWSSNAGWAQTDLFNYMEQASANGPLFIEAFFDGSQWVKRTKGFGVPDAYMLNRVLARHEAGYQIEEPNTLVRVGAVIGFFVVNPKKSSRSMWPKILAPILEVWITRALDATSRSSSRWVSRNPPR